MSAVELNRTSGRSAVPKLMATRVVVVGLAAYLLIYLSWQLFHWLPGRQQLGQAFLIPADMAALCATWMAARRCEGSE
jgi:hypothetical protein